MPRKKKKQIIFYAKSRRLAVKQQNRLSKFIALCDKVIDSCTNLLVSLYWKPNVHSHSDPINNNEGAAFFSFVRQSRKRDIAMCFSFFSRPILNKRLSSF